MKTLRIYLDTSVLGGCYDVEFASWSLGLVADLRAGRFRPVVSDLLAVEVARAPEPVRTLHRELLAMDAVSVTTTAEAVALLEAYEAHAVLGPRYRADMLHIALATVAEAEVLVSWNFRHIVRLDKIRLFNAVNAEQGYRTLAIHSPREVTTYGRESEDEGGAEDARGGDDATHSG
jgi:hypothetical protein